MLFAAGFGTRMGALTADRPKPLLEVAGRSLLDRTLDLAAGAGIDRVVVNAHYRAEMIAQHLAGRQGLSVVVEAPEILETGGGLRNAAPLLGTGPVFTINPDALWIGRNPFETLRAAWASDRMGALLLVVEKTRATAHPGSGDFSIDGAGRLSRRGPMVYTGCQIIDPRLADGVPERAFSLNRVWDRLIEEGRLYGVAYPGDWVDVGTPAGLAAAEGILTGEVDVRL